MNVLINIIINNSQQLTMSELLTISQNANDITETN